MINKEWPLSGQRQCRTNSTKLEETDKDTDRVMCRGHLECQKSMQTSNKHFLTVARVGPMHRADASGQDRFDSYVNNSNIKAALCGSTVD